MEEVWKDIEGYEGLYQVSNLGRVKSFGKLITGTGRGFPRYKRPSLLKPCLTGAGYYFVNLTNEFGIHKMHVIHRLVGKAFIPNPQNKGDINHKDGNKLNNIVSNLEWNTRQENIQHAFRTGLNYAHHNKVNKKKVLVTDADGRNYNFSSIADAALFLDVPQSSVSRACSGKLHHAGGCKCKFV